MLLRKNLQAPDPRISVGLFGLVLGIVLESFGPRLAGLANSAFWDGLVHGVAVVLIALGIFLGVSGAVGRTSHRGPRAQ